MGVKDSKAKEYLSDNRRFSEICNYMLFGGAKIIKPQDLKECDSTEVLSIFGIDRKQIIRQKWRDLLKSVSVKYTGNMYIVLIGIEAQTDVHYAMPVKTMMYDALNYGDQVNEAKKRHQKNKDYKSSEEFLSGFTQDDKLTPVITITLYLGTSKSDFQPYHRRHHLGYHLRKYRYTARCTWHLLPQKKEVCIHASTCHRQHYYRATRAQIRIWSYNYIQGC